MKTPRLIAALVGAMLLTCLVAPTASAEDTPLTFTVASGSLALSIAGEDGALGSATSDLLGTATTIKAIGTMTVTDETGTLAGWTLSASMTGPFVSSTDIDQTGNDTIPCTAATVTTPATATITPALAVTYVGQAAGVALADAGGDGTCEGTTIAQGTLSTGNHTAAFTTSVTVSVPATTLAGSYSGVITQTLT